MTAAEDVGPAPRGEAAGGSDPLHTLTLFDIEAPPPVTVAQEFVCPPFSILDTRQGYWQERKRAWLSLGIASELGRGRALTRPTWKMIDPDYYRNRDAWLSATGQTDDGRVTDEAWELHAYGSVTAPPLVEQDGGALTYNCSGYADHLSAAIQGIGGGTSLFDPVLCELAYRWFSPVGGRVLDPFAGGSVRGVAASILSRHYTGVELRAEQVDANRAQAHIGSTAYPPRWHAGDSSQIEEHVDPLDPAESYDLIFTCPPYADLEVYSDDPRDLSTMPYDDFLTAYRTIFAKCVSYLRDDRFVVVVIGDVRDRRGIYRGLVPDTVQALVDAGCDYYNEGILVNPVGTAAMRTPKQFRASRKFGRIHQNVLVFVKGDPKRAAAACGPVSTRTAGLDDEVPA